MKPTKQLLSVLLALLLVVGLMPLGVSAATLVRSVEATVTTPVVGNTISTLSECTFGTFGVQLTDMNWTQENGAIYPAGTKFKAGETYYCDMEFTAQDGYTFPDSYKDFSGTINGIAGEISSVAYYKDKAYVVVAFTPVLPGVVMIGDVGLYNREYLAVGSSTPTTTKPTSGGYAYLENYVLTLHNFTYQGIGLVQGQRSVAISSSYAITIEVEGENSISCQSDMLKTNGIWTVEDKDLTINGSADSSLAVKGNYSGISSDGTLTLNNLYMGTWGESYGGIFAEKKLSAFNSFLGVFSSNFGIYCREACTLLDTYLEMKITNGVGLWCANGNLETQDCNLRIESTNHAIYLPDGGWSGKNTYLALESQVYTTGDITLTQCRGSVTAENIAINANESALSFTDCEMEIISSDSYVLKGEKGIAFLNGQTAQGAVDEESTLAPYKAAQNTTYGYVKLTPPTIIISSVETLIHLPVAGDVVEYWERYFCTTQGVEITYARWTDEKGSIYSDDHRFEKGKTYYCVLGVEVEEGYIFPDSYQDFSGTINGKQAEISTVYYDNCAYLTVGFTVEEEKDVYVGGVGLESGDYLKVGSTTPTKTQPADGYAHYQNGVLILNNYSFEGTGFVLNYDSGFCAAVFATKSLNVVLEGKNTLTPNHSVLYGSGLEGDLDVNLTVTGNSGASLEITSNDSGIYCDGVLTIDGVALTVNTEDYGVFSDSNLTLKNCNLSLRSRGCGIYGDDGASLTLENCTGKIFGKYQGIWIYDGSAAIADCNMEIVSNEDCAMYANTIEFSKNQQVLAGKNENTHAHFDPELVGDYRYIKITTPGSQPPQPTVTLGDVNGDDKIDAKDALQVLKFAVGKAELTDAQQVAAEVDGQDGINAKDALQILKYSVKKITKFPIEG